MNSHSVVDVLARRAVAQWKVTVCQRLGSKPQQPRQGASSDRYSDR
jgi:hypothetical protein